MQSFEALKQCRRTVAERIALRAVDSVVLLVNANLLQFINVRAVAAFSARGAEDVVSGDPAQPRTKWPLVVEVIKALPRSDDRLLKDIIDGRMVEGNRVDVRGEHLRVLADENVEEVFCAHGWLGMRCVIRDSPVGMTLGLVGDGIGGDGFRFG